ncbi:aminotransferase class I/II-fold pyridoxal phosphate-dependent enzyme [Virgibacillus byunsanensis]|uniref:Aminotransferase class I/II-fold pyridoxal phosphate-dependent enzyme n=1 Tax=Virgibacillus byunsanensis TaxID=570945 RepID=A0ABW3LQI4_9BACI
MKYDQQTMPLFEKLKQFRTSEPISFHVPGHKNGTVWPGNALSFYNSILPFDVTELTGMDDLHAPHSVIGEAELLAADFFNVDHTFFMIGGSTIGNLAMILATCQPGEKIIVQRNCHKSVLNGLELSGAKPIFIAPEYESRMDRYTAPSFQTLAYALDAHPDAKAVILTYPDYFGKTFSIKQMVKYAHECNTPVLVDEAHGVHFSLGTPFPTSAIEHGADVVVQSAHKMAPAMTMTAYLHLNSTRIPATRIAHFLQMLQSSSPSYPLMASLDIARSFLANMNPEQVDEVLTSTKQFRQLMQESDLWRVIPMEENDDPLKLTIHINQGLSGEDVAKMFEQEGIYPELTTHNQVLFIHGLAPFKQFSKVKQALKRINERLKMEPNHATIDITKLFTKPIQELVFSYQEMQQRKTKQVKLNNAKGHVAAEAIIPYPPGIPIVLKGERITAIHIELLEHLLGHGVQVQHRNINNGISVFQ